MCSAAALCAVWVLSSAPAPSALALLVRDYRAAPNPARKAAVEAYAAAHPEEAASAQLALGVTAYEQKDYAAAIAALAPLPAKLPLISDYPAYYLAASRVESGDFDGVPKDLGPVHTGAPSPLGGKAWILEARALEPTAAAQAVQTLRDHYKELPQPDGDLTLAESYQAANDSTNAAEFYQRVYTEYPLGQAADKASAALSALASSMGATFPQPIPEQLLRRADRLFALHAYSQARAEYEGAIDKLAGYQRDEARVRVGASDLAANNAATAYSYLGGLAVPESDVDAERLYYVEECARKLNNDDGALAALKHLSEKHAKSNWRARALYSFANRYLLLNRTADFLPLYKALYSDFPKDGNAPTSRWKVTFQAYERNSADAEGLLRAHLEAYPTHGTAGAAMYFLGRHYERKGQEVAARVCYLKIVERLPNSYYAILARMRLNTPELSGASGGSALAANTSAFLNSLKVSAITPVPTQPTATTTARIDRSRALRAAGLTDFADAELRFGARADAQPTLMAMEIAAAADAPYIGVKAMKALASDYLNRPLASAPRQYWEYLYPMPFRDDLVADARAHNLDPYLVAGLIRQESEFNPAAISSAKANGLMQLELGTARDMARSLGIPRVTLPTLLEAAPNLKIGTAVFRQMLDQNGGNVERTIAGYNAGPRRAAEWSTWNSFREPAEFIETIPFSETREYVQAVLRNADMYRRLYAQ
ncbi:MAG TPA: transglycosylase SLT domain-containing protein [Bryobacteraceae bacterium]|nr:transglycosylase SLT domain-containing protein [Bryobacteraceae bacterium]